MAPVTDFAVKDGYKYLLGLGSYHSSEAFEGANPLVNNTPQKPPYGLLTERLSGSSMTAPRHENLQTWIYRTVSSLDHREFTAHGERVPSPTYASPNSYMWPKCPVDPDADWVSSQKLLASNGEPLEKSGLAIWLFSVGKDMPDHTCFSSVDGDCLIVLQAGALDIQTEFGKLLVRQNEIAVIPRGMRYRVTLPAGCTRGYILELFQGHFQLPNLGIVGSTGLANVRDFQVPTAYYDGKMNTSTNIAEPNNSEDIEWTVFTRLNSQLWSCKQDHTPFDVAAWHGTYYPYKYDLARFCILGNVLFDEHDPTLYTVLTVPSHREPGSQVVDFDVIPPRWNVAEDTYWLPYYHRNTMNEFYGPIIHSQDPEFPLNKSKGQDFQPFVCGLNGTMTAHGASLEDHQKAREADLTPKRVMNEGISIFLFETEMPLRVADWAVKAAVMGSKMGSKYKKREEHGKL